MCVAIKIAQCLVTSAWIQQLHSKENIQQGNNLEGKSTIEA